MKKYNVYGIGNAIVDIVTEVDHDFFTRNNIEKGVMTLVDEKRQLELMKVIDMKRSKMSGGGSAGNTVVALSQFGGKAYYSCLVSRDELGQFFLQDLARNGVDTNLSPGSLPEGHTGRCLVMTTPDAHRTMNTFLGISSSFSPAQITESAVSESAWVYLEGYLVASPEGLKAMKETRRLAEKNRVPVAITFSDPSMVKYFGDQMREVVNKGVDLLFCNDEEAMVFTGTTSVQDAREKLKEIAKKFVITLGADGALVFDGDVFIQIEPFKAIAIDTNGAGDMFAGAFLYGITNGYSFAEAGKLASMAASRVVAQFGPRLTPEEAENILKDLKSR